MEALLEGDLTCALSANINSLYGFEKERKARMSKSYIEVEAFVSSEQEIYCKDCARRKGIKNGKERFIYEIGDTPCRACGIMDILDDVEAYSEAFPAEVKPVVKGEWVEFEQRALGHTYLCSVCQTIHWGISNFCPNCGADMRKEANDGR